MIIITLPYLNGSFTITKLSPSPSSSAFTESSPISQSPSGITYVGRISPSLTTSIETSTWVCTMHKKEELQQLNLLQIRPKIHVH